MKLKPTFKQLVALVFASLLISSGFGVNGAQADSLCNPAVTTDLSYCDLSGANLSGITFAQYTQFTGTNLAGANLSGVTFPAYTSFDGANMAGANLSNIDAFSAVFSRANLQGANLQGANLHGLRGYYTDFSGANLKNAKFFYLESIGANFSNADLSGGSLYGAGLSSAILTGLKVSKADLDANSFGGATSGGIIGRPKASRDNTWKLYRGWLVGHGIQNTGDGTDISGANLSGLNLGSLNLSGSNLAGINLSRANLAGTNLRGANLSGANMLTARLGGVKSGSITGEPSGLPNGWRIIAGYLVGPRANLVGANLAGQNLSGANLISANLTGADISHSYVAGANFAHAVVTGTREVGLIGWPANCGYLTCMQ